MLGGGKLECRKGVGPYHWSPPLLPGERGEVGEDPVSPVLSRLAGLEI